MRITLDGVTTEQEVTLVAVGNSSRYGGGMLIAPGADLTDGVFEVVVADAMTRATLARLKPLVRAGTHVRHPQVHVHRAGVGDAGRAGPARVRGRRADRPAAGHHDLRARPQCACSCRDETVRSGRGPSRVRQRRSLQAVRRQDRAQRHRQDARGRPGRRHRARLGHVRAGRRRDRRQAPPRRSGPGRVRVRPGGPRGLGRHAGPVDPRRLLRREPHHRRSRRHRRGRRRGVAGRRPRCCRSPRRGSRARRSPTR